MNDNFLKIEYKESIFLSKLVSEYTLNSMRIFPYTKCKLRIWKEKDCYVGNLDIKIRNYDKILGFGSTEQEAFDVTVKKNIDLIIKCEEMLKRNLTDSDYVYIDPYDF